MWVKCIKMCFLEHAVTKISDCYLKFPYEGNHIVPHFSQILPTDSKIKEKIVNFINISKSCCHKNKVGQNNWQRTGLLFFILQHKKKIKGHPTLTHISKKNNENKTSQNNSNKKIDRKKKQLKKRNKK